MKYSGKTTCYEHKHGDSWKETPGAGPPALRQQLVLDAQWSNMPDEIMEDIHELWNNFELGNDHYFVKISINSLIEMKGYPLLIEYLRENGVQPEQVVWIHYWW